MKTHVDYKRHRPGYRTHGLIIGAQVFLHSSCLLTIRVCSFEIDMGVEIMPTEIMPFARLSWIFMLILVLFLPCSCN